MKNILNRLDPQSLSLFRQIGALAQLKRVKVYAVGGCVRDLLLKRKILDLDVVVEGDGIALARQLASAQNGKLTAYAQFGTATVLLSNGRTVDFTSARQERYPYSGALPVVSEGSIHDDLFRRDFTINAIAMSITPESFGRLVDDHSGVEDLKERTIRILHNQSFHDDPTRILRAVRFEQRFKFRMDSKTAQLLKQALKAKFDDRVKSPRYFEEFRKNLREENAGLNLKRLSVLGGLRFLGELNAVEKKFRLFAQITAGAQWAHKHLPDWPQDQVWLVHMMAIAEGAGPSSLEAAMARFNFSKPDRKKMVSSLNIRAVLQQLTPRRLTSSETYEILRCLSVEEILLMRAATSDLAIRRRLEQYLLKWRFLRLEINGEDLKAAGLVPGRQFQVVLGQVLSALVEGQCTTRAEQLKYLQTLSQK